MIPTMFELTAVALLILGNFLFRHFAPHYTLAYRACKIAVTVALTAPISYFYSHLGVFIASTPSSSPAKASTAGPPSPTKNTPPSAAGPHPSLLRRIRPRNHLPQPT